MSERHAPGSRLRSVTCDTEVIVIKAPTGPLDLRCGGVGMVTVTAGDGRAGDPRPPFDGGTAVGKRYTNEDESFELLCVKAGAGSLSIAEQLMDEKGAKPLPASD